MSENAICFFSGTGNSFDIAKRLSEKIKNTDIYNIATLASTECLADCKRIGIIFPIYGFTMPNIVKDFIAKLPFRNDSYYFCVATMGAFALGALYRVSEAFTKAGGHLDYATSIYMPENYILFSKVPSDRLIEKHLNNSVKRISDVSDDILSNKSKHAKKPMTYGLVQKISENESAKWKNTAKGFQVSKYCVSCEKCIRLCPVHNISISNKTISFSDRCECCLLCLHACPKQAINYGEKTKNKKRYINPNIDVEEMKKY